MSAALNLPDPVTITRWHSRAHGERHPTTWMDFFAWLESPARTLPNPDGLTEPEWDEHKASLTSSSWSPATFANDHRKKAGCEAVCALVLDYDGTQTVAAARAAWGRFYGVIHTSVSHCTRIPKGGTATHDRELHKLRVVLPLARLVTSEEFARVWRWAETQLPGGDPTTKDPSRLWYPSARVDGRPFEFHRLPGEVLDPDRILAVPEPVPVPIAPARRITAPTKGGTREQRHAEAALASAVALVRSAPSGTRNATLNREAHSIAGLGDALPSGARDDLAAAARDAGLTESEIRKTMDSAWRSGDARPRVLEDRSRSVGVLRSAQPANEPTPRGPLIISLADRIRRLGNRVHIATGFPTIDRATRGGPRLGDLVVLGGAPHAGKTMLVVTMAQRLAAAGYHVGMIASDEAADMIAIRVGQALGHSRDALESDPYTRELCAKDVEADLSRFYLLEASDGHTIESACEYLRVQAGDAPRILVADSLQWVEAIGTDTANGLRERADIVVKSCKRAAAKGALVVITSEVVRGSYRSSDRGEQVNDMAAAKESGGIEYGATLLLVLRSVKGSPTAVDVTMPKNRIGYERPDFRLEMDMQHATMDEGTLPPPVDVDTEREKDRKREAAYERAREKILEAVRRYPGMKSKNQVATKARGDRNATMAAIQDLLDEGTLIRDSDKAFRVASPPSDE